MHLKTISAKIHLRCLRRFWRIPTLTFMNPTPNINTSTKSKDLMQNTSPSLITYPPHPTIKLPRKQTFKTGFRKLSILSKFWEWCKWKGGCGGGVSSCLRRYDALRTKIGMWLNHNFNFVLNVLLESNIFFFHKCLFFDIKKMLLVSH